MIPPLAGHYILRFLVQFALLLASARLCGELMKRYEQPPVFGELLAGLLLGPSLYRMGRPRSLLVALPARPPSSITY